MSARVSASMLLGLVLFFGTTPNSRGASGQDDAGTQPTDQIPVGAVTHLEIDVLDDGVEPPEAFNVDSLMLPPSGEVRFRVLGVASNPRYFIDLTETFARRAKPRQRIDGRVVAPRPSRPTLGTLRFKTYALRKPRGNVPQFHYDAERNAIVYRPVLHSLFDYQNGNTGTIEVRWRPFSPGSKYATRLFLTVFLPH